MPTKDTTTQANGAQAPGPRVVEALANPLAAGFVAAALQEARDALAAQYRDPERRPAGVNDFTPTQKVTLDALASLGAQLVTATTVPPASAS